MIADCSPAVRIGGQPQKCLQVTGAMAPKRSHRIAAGTFILSVREDKNTQLGIYRADRADLPHLTINWGNPSKNINVHLAVNLEKGGKDYVQVASIPESSLQQQIYSFEPDLNAHASYLRSKARRVSVGWLRRRGYRILFLDAQAEKVLIQRVLPLRRVGRKKKKWTHVPDERFLRNPTQSLELADHVYRPKKLREIAAAGYDERISAECAYGKRRGKSIQLMLQRRPNGKPYWVMIETSSFESLTEAIPDFWKRCFNQLLPSGAQAKIYSGLRLDEIGW
jgi:hypothetical protein